MSRESVDAKGRRYVSEGRLAIARVDEHGVEASCRGGGAVYELGHDGEAWWCSCPARGRCAHLVALGLVVVRGPGVDADEEAEPSVTRPPATAAFEDDDDEPTVSL